MVVDYPASICGQDICNHCRGLVGEIRVIQHNNTLLARHQTDIGPTVLYLYLYTKYEI